MMRIKISFVLAGVVIGLVSTLYACDSDEVTTAPPNGANEELPTNPVDADAATPPGKPVYAIGSMIVNPGAPTSTYITLLDSFDTRAPVTLEGSREFPGYAASTSAQGKLLVGDGESPQFTRYAIGEDKSWIKEQTVSFSGYISGPTQAVPIIVSPTVAYMPFDGTNHVVWNPLDFTIVAPMTAPAAIPLERNGLKVSGGFGHAVEGTLVYQPYYWSDTLYAQFSQTSQIAVIDASKNEVSAVLDAPCPHLHIVARDDDGSIYFSNGSLSVASAVVDPAQPRNCAVRVKAGETSIDPTFSFDFHAVTDGREGNNFFPIGNGFALFNVYHRERAPNATAAQINYASADFHLWTYDFATKTAKMMDGIDFAGGQFISTRIDGRTYVAIPAGDYSSTAVYEILPTGVAEKRFDMSGWAFTLFRVR